MEAKFSDELVVVLGDVNSTWFNVPKLDKRASDGLTGTAGFVGPHCAQSCCRCLLSSVVVACRKSWRHFCVDPAFVFSVVIVGLVVLVAVVFL
jgi:hypothetical protein